MSEPPISNEHGLAFDAPNDFAIGRSAGQRSAELFAAARHDAMRTPLTRALTRFSAEVVYSVVRMAASDVPPLLNFIPARTYVYKALVEQRFDHDAPITVVETAAGFSPRGIEMAQAHPAWTVTEIDLPDVIAAKAQRLGRAGIPLPDNLRLIGADLGATPLSQLLPAPADAIISEGLLMYFSRAAGVGIARGALAALRPGGVYMSDSAWRYAIQQENTSAVLRVYERYVSRLVSLVEDGADAESLLRDAGFADVTHIRPSEEAPKLGLPTPVLDLSIIAVGTRPPA